MEEKNRNTPSQVPEEKRRPIENFYDNFRDVPLKYLDIFIGVCMAAIVVFILLGMLKGRGMI
ncbi:MAG: hypothetical protein K2O18_14905 [Oscillospiraceae bacterium]|nr:hypothetical protein [Oscillospiraceae bacterium]